MNSQTLLRAELERILKTKRANAFCREVGIHPTALSEFLKGKRVLMRSAATKYFRTTLHDDIWKKLDLAYHLEETGSRRTIKLYRENVDHPEMTPDEYAMHADPLHCAILLLFNLENFRHDPEWMAKKLDITREQALERLERLIRLGLIEKNGDQYRKTDLRPKYTDLVINPAMDERKRNFLKIIEKAIPLPINKKDFYDYNCSINPDDMPEFQREIRELINRFDRSQFRSRPKEVYTLFLALVPITKEDV